MPRLIKIFSFAPEFYMFCPFVVARMFLYPLFSWISYVLFYFHAFFFPFSHLFSLSYYFWMITFLIPLCILIIFLFLPLFFPPFLSVPFPLLPPSLPLHRRPCGAQGPSACLTARRSYWILSIFGTMGRGEIWLEKKLCTFSSINILPVREL